MRDDRPAAQLEIRAVNEGGVSIAGAVVDLLWIHEGRAISVARAVTGESETVRFEDVPVGTVVLVAQASGRARGFVTEDLSPGANPALTITLEPEATLEGHLFAAGSGETRTPLGGVVVRAVQDGGSVEPPFAIRSSADGSFLLNGLRPGTYRVEVDDARFEAVVRRAVPVPSRGMEISLRAMAELDVTVRLASGNPAENASVTIAGSGLWPARAARTDALGHVILRRVPSGVYELRATRETLVAEPVAPLILEPGAHQSASLTLGEGSTLRGTIVDAQTQRPIASARLVIAEDALSSQPLALQATPQGSFVATGLLRRSHLVSARAAGFVPQVGVRVMPDGAEPVVVALDREVIVEGRVVDGRGRPIANAQVELSTVDLDGRVAFVSAAARTFRDALFERQLRGPTPLQPGGELGVTVGRVPRIPLDPSQSPSVLLSDSAGETGFVTDSRGAFRVSEIAPGMVRVIAVHPAYVRAESVTRATRAGETVPFEIVLHEGGTLDGRLVDGRGFALGSQLVEVRVERDPTIRRVFTGRDGTFRVPSLLGRCAVYAVIQGHPVARREVQIDDGQTVTVELVTDGQTRRVRGRVVDRRGFPLGGVDLTVTAGGAVARAVSEPDGSFEALATGHETLVIEARHPRFAPRVVRVTDATDETRIELEPGATVSVSINARACSQRDVTVELRTPCGPLRRTGRPESTHRFEGVCAGRLEAIATAEGCVPARTTGTCRAEQLVELSTLELVAGGAVEGEVVDRDGQPIPGAELRLEGAEGASLGRADRSGHFSLATVSEGERRLVAVHPLLGRSEPADVRVLRGTTARGIRLRFARPLAGASAQQPEQTLRLAMVHEAVTVVHVETGSSADRAGLRANDIVRTVDGQTPRDAESVSRRVSNGESLVLEVERDSVRRIVRLTP